MIDERAIGRRTARILLDTGSILLRPDRPFMLSSGWASPAYLDMPRALSFPLARRALLAGAEDRILAEVGFDGFDAVAATEQGGIAIGAMLAERFHLPFVTVRRRAQGFGADAHIEGALRPGARTLLVSDVTTDGRSKAGYSRALTRAGAEVTQIFVLFKWGIFDRVVTDIADVGARLFALATWEDVLPEAEARGALPAAALDELRRYLADPFAWSAAHGGLPAPV
ncbi:orotate phosphoribosyltransferase [Falsiroseomonas selenitidurans]|uniref:Orotate phosphoribosyltransferase n=1 Tax=Falsiroseomonas selenitidurans TaxID=2716335 RepID=A0ABX1E4M3_9PROT|nr:orotate phosphoribosyltransferase [Falsiroseomonas selenitidurans]NKC29875.1 orotate phosphoribosyltransferase [Falsiroseomonas selenitidurans]